MFEAINLSNLIASLFILIAVVLLLLTIVFLLIWMLRGGGGVLFPGLGLIISTPAFIVSLLVLAIITVAVAGVIKPKESTFNPGYEAQNFEYPNDIFSGCGNGTLGLSISKDPNNYNLKTDRHLKICINDEDLAAIQDFVVSGRIKYDNLNREDFKQADEQNQKIFQKFAAECPMLGRIDDMYSDYIFNVEDVQKLRAECLKLQSQNPDSAADLALRKFIYACDEALKENYFLMFGSD